MQLTKGAIGNLINRYKAVLKKCHLLNAFGSLAVAGMLVMGSAGIAGAAVASVNGHEYDTLEQAVNVAQTGDRVTLLQDSTGNGIVINTSQKSITIDLNGHTYSVTGKTVGSHGTETNGFQLLKGGSLTITNGTLAAGTNFAKILIQNYCNLTLDNVTLEGSQNTSYVLSNNNGDTVLKGGTVINAAEGTYAFDAYYWPTNGHTDGVNVTVEDATINGEIEYATDGTPPSEGKHEINITGGTFTDPTAAAFVEPGKSITLLTDTGAITITGGADPTQPAVAITNPDRMLHQTATIDTSSATQPKVTITTSINKASDVLPGLSSELNPVMAHVWNNGVNDVNADAMGVRFLSRAANTGYIAEADKAAATIESAARMAFAGAVPQMTKMASDAATNAVVNRLGFANPADGIQAMDAEGKIVDRNTTGFALWIAPLWQNMHGWGMEAGNLDYGFNGNLGGVSLGADYTFENAIRAGITFNIGGGYAESSGGDLSSTQNNMNFWGLGAYVGWNYQNFGLMADVAYTSTWNDLSQDMDGRMGMGDLEADVQASALSAGVRAEYKLETSVLDVIPHIGVRYMSLNTWGYDVESSGGTLLEADGFHQDIWTFPVGITFSKDLQMGNGWAFTPSVDFSVIPAAGDIKAKHDVQFTGVPVSAEMETQMMDYLTWQGGIGLELGNENMSIGVNYTLQAGQNSTGHGLFGSFRYEF